MMNSAPNYRHWLLTLSLAAAAPGFAASAGSPATDAPATASGVAPATTAAPSAATFQDVHELEALARSEASRDFPPLTERQRFVIGPIEPRLELERCRQPVRAALTSAHHMPDRATVELRCQNAKPWHLYVQVRIVGTSSVAVAAHAIVAGSVLTAKDMRVEQHDISELPLGFLDDPAIAVGLTAARPIPGGAYMTNQQLLAAKAVQRGQSVTLVADAGGLSVRMAGKALSDGLMNQRVKVQNLSSGKIVEGIARSEQVVEIISQ
ncbi:MAG TPA: flagellar basal body P-ring formation chaperone FlgA [Steroidobacteraceae bacterium]|nr:flagellar basal body P-ring formation chaperone FlgA [Steroidobacteraceae bacterium]